MEKPLVTIGMPTKNIAWCLPHSLKAIEELKYPKKGIRIVFVDDHSTDDTWEIISEWTNCNEKMFHDILLFREHTNIPQARNLCIRHMKGNYILFWDSDVIPPNDLLAHVVAIMESNNEIGIIGADYVNSTKNSQDDSVVNKYTHAVFMGFTLIRKKIFDEVGLFNELLDVGEDTEFGLRTVEKTGHKIMWAPWPVLHLKSGHGERFRYTGWLSYNFYERGRQYAESFQNLPLFLKIRIFYYLLLPAALVLSSYLAFCLSVILMPLALIVYLLPGLFLSIRSLSIRRGTRAFFRVNILVGIALSYGTLMYTLRSLLKKVTRNLEERNRHRNSCQTSRGNEKR